MENLFETIYSGYDTPIQSLLSVRFNIRIISYRGCIGPDMTTEKTWHELRFDQIKNRWWYFRRVAAKMQIESPRKLFCFHVERVLREDEVKDAELRRLKNKLKAAKAKVTEIENKMEKAKSEWNRLFPIEDDETYQRAQAKLFQKKQEVITIQKEIENGTN